MANILVIMLIAVVGLMMHLRATLPPSHSETAPLNPADEFAFSDDRDFTKLGQPRPGDWLEQHPEPGQTFDQYQKSAPIRPDKIRSKIVLQPIGPFNESEQDLLNKLTLYTSRFFQMPVILNQAIPLPDAPESQRSQDGQTQYHTGYLREKVLAPRLPADAFCYLGITLVDLYPDENWNYVFGEASFDKRVGVYSLIRYFPSFRGEPDTPANRIRTLRHSCATLAHETGHMFGMAHCIFYECLMCGSNSLEESDRQPLHLCPVCLKKLHWNIGFDVFKRYGELADFYRINDLTNEADWLDHRMTG